MSILHRMVAITVVVMAISGTGLHAQQEIFERGNQLYQDGDFAGAVDAYEAVMSAGFESAELHYNLANAYFKSGELGRSILEWERALALSPGDEDAQANLELARSLTQDAVEPLPRFWLLSALSRWVRLLPRSLLILMVGGAWLTGGVAVVTRILARSADVQRWAGWLAVAAAVVVAVFGTNLVVRELGLGQPERAVILAEAVPVRSAPSDDDDLTLFEIHEGTSVRVEQRTGMWAEVVLDDGKVGWVPGDVMEAI
ncbi:MAG: tetratricopeptide repeat protein [Gemmatimonadota bacterium]|jgi:tetratricopeptide (TPR) repeat protein